MVRGLLGRRAATTLLMLVLSVVAQAQTKPIGNVAPGATKSTGLEVPLERGIHTVRSVLDTARIQPTGPFPQPVWLEGVLLEEPHIPGDDSAIAPSSIKAAFLQDATGAVTFMGSAPPVL